MRINDLLSEQELQEFGSAIPAAVNIASRTGKSALKPLAKGAVKLAKRLSQAGAKGGIDKFAKFNKATGRLLLTLKGLGLATMAYSYYDDMEDAVAMVEKGKWTPEQYHQYRQQRMATLVGQIATSTVLFGALKLASGWTLLTTGMRVVPYAPVANLGKLLSNLDSAATVGLMAYLNTEAGKNVVAEIIGTTMIDQTLGDMGTAVVDKFKKIFKIADKVPEKDPNAGDDTNQQAQDNKDAAGQQGSSTSQQGARPTPGQQTGKPTPILSRPEWVTTPSGKQELKIDPEFAKVPRAGRTLADMEAEKKK